MKMIARGVAALALLDDLAYFYYPLPLSNLVSVRCNRLLSKVRISRQAPTMLPWQAEANLHKSKVDGDCVRVTNRRQSDSEDRRKSNRLDTSSSRHLIAQRVQFFKLQPANVRGQGASPLRSLGGSKGGHSLTRENGSLCRTPAGTQGKARIAAALHHAQRNASTAAPSAQRYSRPPLA